MPWGDLPLETISALLATDFQNGLRDEDAAARLRLVASRRSRWKNLWLTVFAAIPLKCSRREVRILREGRFLSASIREIVPGDVLELARGEQAPLDVRIVEADELTWRKRGFSQMKDYFQSSGTLLYQGDTILSGRARVVAVTANMGMSR